MEPRENPSFEAGGQFAISIAKTLEMMPPPEDYFMFFLGMFGPLAGSAATAIGKEGMLEILSCCKMFIETGYKEPSAH